MNRGAGVQNTYCMMGRPYPAAMSGRMVGAYDGLSVGRLV